MDIRVYNSDFVDEHLEFFRDPDKSISPFAVLGKKNKEAEAELEHLLSIIGDSETNTGLSKAKHDSGMIVQELERKHTQASNALETKMKRFASEEIKHKLLNIHNDPNYNIAGLRNDIESIRQNPRPPLTESEIDQKKDLIRSIALSDIRIPNLFAPAIGTLYASARKLLGRKIQLKKAIPALLEDPALHEWVKAGIPFHRNNGRNTCAFCNHDLPEAIWDTLDAHFSQESIDLERDLEQLIQTLDREKQASLDVVSIQREQVYASMQEKIERVQLKLTDALRQYQTEIETLKTALYARKHNIFRTETCHPINDNSNGILHVQNELVNLIRKNNDQTLSLTKDIDAARQRLRLDAVAKFMSDISIEDHESEIAKLWNDLTGAKSELRKVHTEISKATARIEILRSEQIDEKQGANRINELLQNFFGHQGLHLESSGNREQKTFQFRITRDGEDAYNLSEGERSLISFCYFISKLHEVNSQSRKMILYIDDPISSLDSNHVFFIFSLIQNIVNGNAKNDAQNEEARQGIYIECTEMVIA